MTTFPPRPCEDGVIRAERVIVPCAKASAKWILTATILGSSMAFIDGTVVNVALPALQKDLKATVVGLQWVIESYALLLAALLLVGGSMGDRYGRRKVFVIGVAVFASASAWCGFASNIEQLIAARARPGNWRSFANSREPGDHQQFLFRRRPWPGDRDLVGL